MPAPRPIFRGMMFNVDAGLFLPFMINPQPVSHEKTVTYDIQEIPGVDGAVHTYQSGGQKVISFNLFFDVTEINDIYLAMKDNLAAGIGLGRFKSLWGQFIELVGVRGIEAIIESTLRPQQVSLTDPVKKRLIKQGHILNPPQMTLLMGLRFWKGVVTAAPIEETRFDGALNPLQINVPITFSVIEEGRINDLNQQTRKGLSLASSTTSTLDISIDFTNNF